MSDKIEQHLREIKGEIGSRSFGELEYLFLIDVLDVYLADMPKVLRALRVQREALDLIKRNKDSCLLGKCCVQERCFVVEGVCEVQKKSHSAFQDQALIADKALSEIEALVMGDKE